MEQFSSVSLNTLSPEVADIIFSVLPTSSLRSLRLVSHHINSIATKWAFQHIRLGARQGHLDHEHFIKVARSDQLRPFVREVTCDTWLGSEAEKDGEFHFSIPQDFLKALPLLRCFDNLRAVHLRFDERTKHVFSTGEDAETDDFRYRVLDTVFQCIAGSYSSHRQKKLDKQLFGEDFQTKYVKAPANFSNLGPIPIRELTVSNLADFDDTRLTDSPAFKEVLAMRSLKTLKLCIAQQQVDANNPQEGQPESALWFREKYDMFDHMPATWLSPSIAANLKVLSLYSKDYWGWNPRLDFRAILPGDGPDCRLPQLKVLALGMYVFSHEWQFDWIASLGQMNGSGGLEELYLDRCPIMVQARHHASPDHGSRVVGQDSEGNDVSVSNEGYYLIEGLDEDDYDAEITVEDFPIRWHQVLPRWRETMKALKVLRFGQSSWDFAPKQTAEACRLDGPADEGRLGNILHHNNFRDFGKPSPPPSTTHKSSASLERYRLGTGIDQHPKFQARYIYFDINNVLGEWCEVYWPSEAYSNQPQLAHEVREKDMVEMSRIFGTVDDRRSQPGN